MNSSLRGFGVFSVCVLAAAACLPTIGCVAEPADAVGSLAEVATAEENVAEATTSFEDFKAATPWDKALGAYIVEGDIPLHTEEALARYYEEHVQQGALIVNTEDGADDRWSDAQKRSLSYCVSTSFGANYDTVVAAMIDATAAWEQVANVHYIYVSEQDGSCTSSNNNVVFDVRPVSGTTYNAVAFLPSWSRSDRELFIDWANATNAAPKTLTGILRHELGHTLGFRHEHTRDKGSCYEDSSWRALSPYDAGSVMHYRQCPGGSWDYGDYTLTQRDRDGAVALYDGAANLLVGGNGVTYARKLPSGGIYRYSPQLGTWSQVGGPRRMFAVNNTKLYAITTSGGAVMEYSGSGMTWTQIGGAAGQIYAGGDSLFATDPNTGSLFRYNGAPGQWTAVGAPGRQFVVNDTALYGLSPSGDAIFEFSGTPNVWTQISGPAAGMFVSASALYKTDVATGDLYRYNGSAMSWTKVGGPGRMFAGNTSSFYRMTPEGGSVWKYGSPMSWKLTGGAAGWLAAGGSTMVAAGPLGSPFWSYSATQNTWTAIGAP